MARKENKLIRKRLANAYLSSVISISLVLLLIGTAALLIVNAKGVSDYFKESMQISVLMKPEVSEDQAAVYKDSLDVRPFVNQSRVISREEGTEDLKEMLGEDFLSVFESSPVPVSVELSLKADYVSADSLATIIPIISDSELVDEVESQQPLVEALNTNLARISLVLSVFIALLLFISFVLINNTVRINVFARRFTVHTMKLVGATRGFIRRPFMWRAVFQGLIASLLAIGALTGILFAVRKSFSTLFEIFSTKLLVLVMAFVVVCGVLICVVSTYFVVNKLVGLAKDELYY